MRRQVIVLVGWFEYSSPLCAACRHLRRLLMPGQVPVETIVCALNRDKKGAHRLPAGYVYGRCSAEAGYYQQRQAHNAVSHR